MKITASGGTDGANIVLFWPDNMPEDADARIESDPITLVEHLRIQGKLIWFPCDAAGEYTVAVFIRRAIPADLFVHCREEECIPNLEVRGVGYFGGMEYIFKDDSSLLIKYPGMCEPVCIPEGVYAARVYCTALPEELYDSWLLSQVGTRAKRLWDLHGNLSACSVLTATRRVARCPPGRG